MAASNKRVSIRIRLAVWCRVSNLIGKVFSCREKRYGFESRITRDIYKQKLGKVTIGRVKYLLNIV